MTPGTTGRPGKWPAKKYSSGRKARTPTMRRSASSTTRSRKRKGSRCGSTEVTGGKEDAGRIVRDNAQSIARRTIEAFVPPKPKEFFRMVRGRWGREVTGRFRTAETSSGCARVAFPAMNPSRIIKRQYAASLAPDIQH